MVLQQLTTHMVTVVPILLGGLPGNITALPLHVPPAASSLHPESVEAVDSEFSTQADSDQWRQLGHRHHYPGRDASTRSVVLMFGSRSMRRLATAERLKAKGGAGVELRMVHDSFETELDSAFEGVSLVVSPTMYPGMVFPPYLRIAQCVGRGVPVIVEQGECTWHQ
jgi:hypothetical protein